MNISTNPDVAALAPKLDRVFDLSVRKIAAIEDTWNPADGTPVFTVNGQYTTRGWTEWTQGFQFGCAILAHDATGDANMLDIGRRNTIDRMAPHLTHIGVHDHGFNNVSTYGNLRRLAREGKLSIDDGEMKFYELALKITGAVQAARWTPILDDTGNRNTGFVHSFNGPHSLFSDTIRSMRALSLSWQLGHVLMAENDSPISLMERMIKHAQSTAKYNIYYGEGRDAFDTPEESGRVVHESIFNCTDGRYRCPSTQQGYSPFSTWTRGLSWITTGYAEELEFLETLTEEDTAPFASLAELKSLFLRAAETTAEWFIRHSFTDGMVYWDAGAPNIPDDIDYSSTISDPYNSHESIDSSAAAIIGQGYLRLSNYLAPTDAAKSNRYLAAAVRIADTLFSEPYLSTDANHQGLILHSIYHNPNGWDHTPEGQQVPCGESSMWGDYHALELALLLKRRIENAPYITFFDKD